LANAPSDLDLINRAKRQKQQNIEDEDTLEFFTRDNDDAWDRRSVSSTDSVSMPVRRSKIRQAVRARERSVFGDESSDEGSVQSIPRSRMSAVDSVDSGTVLNSRTVFDVSAMAGDDEENQAEWDRELARSEQCFGCMWGSSQHDKLPEGGVKVLLRFLDESYGNMDNVSMAGHAHVIFKQLVYTPMIREGKRIVDWPAASILAHIEQRHMLDPRIFVGESLRHFGKAEEKIRTLLDKTLNRSIQNANLANMEISEEEAEELSQQSASDMKNMERLVRLSVILNKQQVTLYKGNPKDWNFLRDGSAIDIQTPGSLVNLYEAAHAQFIVFHINQKLISTGFTQTSNG